jgi:tRNA nucleotidyltransferase/poly(A) polymerase
MKMEIIKNGGEIFFEKPEYQVIRAKFPTYGAADFALPRKDGNYSDGRHPDSTEIASTLYEDSCRRDFTINAMYKNIATGEIIDYHEGQEDLKASTIRCVGEAEDRIKEDSLRLLRALRFMVTKDFLIDRELYRCFVYSEYTRLLQNVSPERIREEMYKCFKHDTVITMAMLMEYNYLRDEVFNDRTKLWLKPTNEEK